VTIRPDIVQAAAERIRRAAVDGTPVPPVRDLLGSDDLSAAYAVQQVLVAERLAAGQRIVGHKIGLTNPKVQAQLGVDQPDSGVLFDDMQCPDGATIGMERLLQPKIEAEVAFVLGADLHRKGPITSEHVRDAVAYAGPALEIVDSRIAGWDISIVDTVADNASSGLFVLGAAQVSLEQFTPAGVEMTLHRDGHLESEGNGVECLGDPLVAVAWLAMSARDRGRPLRAGEVILSGALGPMVTVEPASTYTATISALGSVSAVFGPAGLAINAINSINDGRGPT
jgi:2-keto-4-pentenoate hydratase